MTPQERVLQGRLDAHRRWGRLTQPDRRAATEKARNAWQGRFEQEVRAEHPEASEADVAVMARHRLQAEMTRLALRRAQKRSR